MTERTEIERLDLAARAEAIKASFARYVIVFGVLSCFLVLLAIVSGASFYETLAVRVLAILALLTTVTLWLKSRYAVYAMDIFFFAALVGMFLPFDDPDDHTLLGSAARWVTLALILGAVYRCWTNARPFAEAQSAAFEHERSVVEQWMRLLNSSEKPDRTVEFSTRSFWNGYWTYCLLNTGSCWLIQKFKTGNMERILSCRVRQLREVRVAEEAGGGLAIEMGNESYSKVHLAPEVRDRLLRLVSAGC